MAQYKEIKSQYQDAILMFRLGDFYEMFFEDALEACKILQITLTARNKNGEDKIPMCGVPYHAVENYLLKLTRAGKKVALCDQVTQPNGKGIVQREVVRVVTPGTTFNENFLDQKSNNFISAIVYVGKQYGFAYGDLTTGEFRTTEFVNSTDLLNELNRINPAEFIGNADLIQKIKSINVTKNLCAFPYEFSANAEEFLKKQFQVNSLKGFGLENRPAANQVIAMLLQYLQETQKTELKHIQKISFYEKSDFMQLDSNCIRNLELFYNSHDGKKEGSLIEVLDHTVNSMGGRLLRNWLLHPLLEAKKVSERLNKVEIFVKDSNLLREISETLMGIYDIERLLSRLSLGSGNARDLIAMKESLKIIPGLKDLISQVLPQISEELETFDELVDLIDQAIIEEPPLSLNDGGIIKKGYNDELDELLAISTEGKSYIKDLQTREIQRTGISSLKVKFNQVFGYYIEISKANLLQAPQDYIRKQTLVNAERFITPELKEYEEKVLNAQDRIVNLEYELFYKVRLEVVKEIVKIQKIAGIVAELDVLSSLAFLAVKNNYCKPEILENGDLEIIDGRHPVVEKVVQDFIPNDCQFDNERKFLMITGPNMGGKSTYLRQIALISLMAQIGSFVPAKSANLPIVDRIFTRVGASDNLARGESTFMVEMNETSAILNQATEKSLIILDEVGRGTSTYDGVSIAWAISEYLHDKIGAKTLFATHYHELIELAEKLPYAQNLSVAVRENEKEGVVFLYKIVAGGVDKSYGIEVAKLAGLPIEVVSRARGVLKEMEKRQVKNLKNSNDQISLFPERESAGLKHPINKFLEELKQLNVENLTPLQALQKLDEIKKWQDNQ